MKPHAPLLAASAARAGLLALCLAAGLAGCALPQRPTASAVYDFGPGPLTLAPADSGAARQPPLALANIEAPPALDGLAVLYRLAYADAQQLRPYARARWSMPPAQLLQQRLREQLGQQGPVVAAADGLATRELRVELQEFSQVFETAAQSVGLVRLRATLLDTGAASGRRVLQHSVLVRRAAPSADAAGGVRALTEASDAALQEVVRWMQAQP